MTRTVCLVTDEMYPFTRGGIGRVLHNLVRDSLARSSDVEFILMLAGWSGGADEVRARFGPRVRARAVPFSSGWTRRAVEGRVFPPAAAFTDSPWHAESLDLLLALRRLLAEGVRLDVVEFPDYRGWAYCALQEKRLGVGFEQTEIAVRLHTTEGILQHFEPRDLVNEQAGGFELERKALLDADRVVAHLARVARYNQEHYGFAPDWRDRVTVEFPPVVDPPVPARHEPVPVRDVVFATRIQPVKAPDVFVRGAALFLSATPTYRGRVVLSCHTADEEYLARVRRMVPRSLASRFAFVEPGADRERLLGRSIVVVPSLYESLNLTAYEAAAAGAVLVLNGRCVAFGDGTPFEDGVNCHKYDGTVEGLAAALDRACRAPAPSVVRWEAAAPYWLSTAGARPPSRPRNAAPPPRVSVVIPNYNLGRYLPDTVGSVVQTRYPDLEVIIVDDCSTDDADAAILERLESVSGGGLAVRVIRSPVNRGLSGARNLGVRAATGAYVLPLDADDCIAPSFLETAVRALETHPQYDVVVPTCGFFESEEELAERRFCDYAVFLGDVPSLGLAANRFSTATSLLRRSLFERFAYDETLTSFEDWDLYLRLALDGRRFLVTNDVLFFYRRRPGSMIKGITPGAHLGLVARLLESAPKPLPPSVQLFPLLIPTANAIRNGGVTHPGISMGLIKPLRYAAADWLNDSVKHVPGVHAALKTSARWARDRLGSWRGGSRRRRG